MNRNNRKGFGRAFTIIEVIVIITIIGIIAAVVAPRLISRIGGAKQAKAKSDMSSLANQIRAYEIDNGKIEPGATIDILWEKPSTASDAWRPYVEKPEDLIDPWGEKYILLVPGKKNVSFDLISYGSDKQPDGVDEAADIVMP